MGATNNDPRAAGPGRAERVMNSRRFTASASRASDRKDSTPRHGRLLHPSSWAQGDDRDHSAENFFQGGSPKQATPFPRQDLLTARNRFTPNFRGWGLDENLKPKSPPYRGAHIEVRRLPERPQRAIRVTSVRMRREDRSSISFSSRTLQAMRASLLASAMARTL